MSKKRKLNIFHCNKTNDGTTIKPIHEMGIKLYWASEISGKVHMEKIHLVATDYTTKWVETSALNSNTTIVNDQILR
jgi:hypothetical protein